MNRGHEDAQHGVSSHGEAQVLVGNDSKHDGDDCGHGDGDGGGDDDGRGW